MAPLAEHEKTDAPAPLPLRILLVDDNREATIALAKQLRLKGHEVEMAFDGKAAIDMSLSFAPDAVILDIGMPGLDGYHTAPALRGQEHRAAIIALTGHVDEEDKRKAVAAGFDFYLTKPASLADIEAVLVKL